MDEMSQRNRAFKPDPLSAQATSVKNNYYSPEATVSILMGTYNGEQFLREQLDSIISQTHKNWKLYISDDGSTDATLDIINAYIKNCEVGKISVIQGPQQGFAKNFLSLIQNKNIDSDYYAFSDQDDIWLPCKIEESINSVIKIQEEKGCNNILYASRTYLIDENGNKLNQSTIPKRALIFRNALIENFASGNTMLFTRALREIILDIRNDSEIIAHDWLLYLACTACGGEVHFNNNPQVLYRQHGKNLIGGSTKIKNKIKNYIKLIKITKDKRKNTNIEIIENITRKITNENMNTLYFYKKKGRNRLENLYLFFKSGVYRQRRFETIAFALTNILAK